MKMLSGFFAAMLFCMLVGCSYTTSSISSEEITVGFMAAEFSNEFMISIQQGFLDRMEFFGLEAKMLLCNVDPALQISQEEDLIVQGVDALVIRPADSEIAETLIEIAEQNQIPVFLYDCYIQEENVVSVITTDNYAIGQIAAESMGQYLLEKRGEAEGKIAILSGNQANSSHTERVRGFREYIQNVYPEIDIVAESSVLSEEKILDTTQDWMTIYGSELSGIYSVTDFNTVIAVEGIESQGYSTNWREENGIIVISTDGTPDSIALIRDHRLAGVVSQNAVKIGEKSAEIVEQYLTEKKQVNSFYYIPSMLITSENIDSEAVQSFGLWADWYRERTTGGGEKSWKE